MPEIEIIAATKTLQQQPLSVATRKKRVAAYARVSTEQDEQQSSYEAQVDFYTRHIKSNPDEYGRPDASRQSQMERQHCPQHSQ